VFQIFLVLVKSAEDGAASVCHHDLVSHLDGSETEANEEKEEELFDFFVSYGCLAVSSLSWSGIARDESLIQCEMLLDVIRWCWLAKGR